MKLLEVRVHETAQSQDPYDSGDSHVEPERPEDEHSADIRDGISKNELDAKALIRHRASLRKRAAQVGLALLCVLVVAGVFDPAPSRRWQRASLLSRQLHTRADHRWLLLLTSLLAEKTTLLTCAQCTVMARRSDVR